MTVGELIELLGSFPPALRVVVDGYEEGYDDLTSDRILKTKIDLNAGTRSWQGQHGDSRDRLASGSDAETAEALVFRRSSH